jgi:hypothetical protein
MNSGGCIGAAEEVAEDVVEVDVEIRTRINLSRQIPNSY